MNDTIYDTIPEETLNKKYTKEYRDQVLEVLKREPGRFYTSRELAQESGLPVGGTQIEVRYAITLLIEVDNQPIVSNVKGYAYTENPHQLEFYAKDLQNRMNGLQRRINAIRRTATKLYGVQK